MQVTFRPIDFWPAEFKPTGLPGNGGNPFRASYSDTLERLDRELGRLGAHSVVIQIAIREDEVRNDGLPRSTARPSGPGVIISFESRHGPLRYGTAEFANWQANLRAIALGLEALRKVERYGIGKRGEQYQGWRQLEAGNGNMRKRGADLIAEHGGVVEALKATHPDHGGDQEDFLAVQAAR